MRTAHLALAVAVVLTGSVAAQAATLYSQPPEGSLADTNAAFSQRDTSGGIGEFERAYDNFNLTLGGFLDGLTWRGAYDIAGAPNIGSISSFQFRFWDDTGAGGSPGSMLDDQTQATFTETLVGTDGGFEFYDYSASLPSTFTANPGEELWMSVTANLDSGDATDALWGWSTSTAGDDIHYTDADLNDDNVTDPGEGRLAFVEDLAFTLEGSAVVPEPGSLMLGACVTLFGGGAAARRKLKNKLKK